MRRSALPVLFVLLVAGCGGADGAPRDASPPALTGTQAQPPAPPAAGTLAQVPDSRPARTRLGYVNRALLAGVDVPSGRVVDAVLGRGAAPDAVRVGARAVVPAGPAPETSAITPRAMSSAQACLGDTAAQTILGPGQLGRDSALGVGISTVGGPAIRICAAPATRGQVHAFEAAAERRYPRADVGEEEITEREVGYARVPLDALSTRQVVSLLTGGRELRRVAWR